MISKTGKTKTNSQLYIVIKLTTSAILNMQTTLITNIKQKQLQTTYATTYLDVLCEHHVEGGHEVVVLRTLEVFESPGQHRHLVLLVISLTRRVEVQVIILILVSLTLASLYPQCNSHSDKRCYI